MSRMNTHKTVNRGVILGGTRNPISSATNVLCINVYHNVKSGFYFHTKFDNGYRTRSSAVVTLLFVYSTYFCLLLNSLMSCICRDVCRKDIVLPLQQLEYNGWQRLVWNESYATWEFLVRRQHYHTVCYDVWLTRWFLPLLLTHCHICLTVDVQLHHQWTEQSFQQIYDSSLVRGVKRVQFTCNTSLMIVLSVRSVAQIKCLWNDKM